MVNNWVTGCFNVIQHYLLVMLIFISLVFSFDTNAAPTDGLKKNDLANSQDVHIINVGLPSHPFHQTEQNEQFDQLISFLKEYWQIWAIDSRLSVNFVYLPPHELPLALEDGRADVSAVSLYSPNHTDTLFSLPYANYKQFIFRRLTSTNQSLIKLGIHQFFQQPLNFLSPNFQPSYYDDLDKLIANHNQYSALYSHQPKLLSKKLDEHNFLKDYYVSSNEVPPLYLRFATHKSKRHLMYLINEGIRNINKEQATVWKNKYPSSHKNLLEITLGNYIRNLSESEKQYVIDHIEIKYPVTEKGRPPYVIASSPSSISERGLAIDLLNIAQDKMGPVFVPFYVQNNEHALDSIITQQADVLVHTQHEQISNKHLSFTSPYINSHYNIIFRHMHSLGKNFEQLGNGLIAVVRNSKTSTLLKRKYPKATFREYSSSEEAIFAVSSNQANAYIGHPLTAGYIIKQNKLSNLRSQPLKELAQRSQFSFAASEQNTALITLLNRSLASITPEKFDQVYTKWSKTSFPENDVQEQLQSVYRKASYILGLIFLFAVLVFAIYYRQIQIRERSRKQIENDLVKAEEARVLAEKSAQEKITFLARMSHEIRTPMNGVFGMAEALAFTELNPHQQELLGTLKSSAGNLMALLNDVLDFSKMDAGKLTLESVPVNLHQLTRNVINGFKSVTPRELSLESHVDDNITHNYLTDPTRLTQILNNLISNAIKFTEQGQVSLKFSIENSKTQNGVQTDFIKISVTDTGIGIPVEHQSSLFTPFKQADDQITRKFGGTGLGLSICQEIVTAMSSSIHLESSSGAGSNFYFTLALKQSGVESDTDDRRKNKRVINPPNDNRFKDLKVLVAEDNLVNLKVLTAQLERLNIHADIAEDGEQALALHSTNTYDIIISDCHMPKVDGFELASTISNQVHTKPIWLIAITADALSGAAENCIQAGFNDYMSKPCPQEVITDKLNNAYRQLIRLRDN
jgi:signal transduction histidine kinase/CheY-like chemotaxis protein